LTDSLEYEEEPSHAQRFRNTCSYEHAQWYSFRCDKFRALFGRVLDPESFVQFYSETSGLYLCGSHKL